MAMVKCVSDIRIFRRLNGKRDSIDMQNKLGKVVEWAADKWQTEFYVDKS